MELSSTVIREMGKRSEEIGGIVNTINVIAERTNLLSLNASIEAAMANRLLSRTLPSPLITRDTVMCETPA